MPTLSIKDYIIAALLVLLLGSTSYSLYTKSTLDDHRSILKEQNRLSVAQIEKIKLLKKQSKQTEEYLNEKYDVQLTMLNTTITGLRDKREVSLLPTIPKGSPDPSTTCFNREKLDEAISGYRRDVQRLVGEGTKAVIGLDIAKEWVKTETTIYEE